MFIFFIMIINKGIISFALLSHILFVILVDCKVLKPLFYFEFNVGGISPVCAFFLRIFENVLPILKHRIQILARQWFCHIENILVFDYSCISAIRYINLPVADTTFLLVLPSLFISRRFLSLFCYRISISLVYLHLWLFRSFYLTNNFSFGFIDKVAFWLRR